MDRLLTGGLLLGALFFSHASDAQLSDDDMALIELLLGQNSIEPYEVCIRVGGINQCTYAYDCEQGAPIWTVSPMNPNHIYLDSPCLNWKLRCGDGVVVDKVGTVCIFNTGRDEVHISITRQGGLSIVKR